MRGKKLFVEARKLKNAGYVCARLNILATNDKLLFPYLGGWSLTVAVKLLIVRLNSKDCDYSSLYEGFKGCVQGDAKQIETNDFKFAKHLKMRFCFGFKLGFQETTCY